MEAAADISKDIGVDNYKKRRASGPMDGRMGMSLMGLRGADTDTKPPFGFCDPLGLSHDVDVDSKHGGSGKFATVGHTVPERLEQGAKITPVQKVVQLMEGMLAIVNMDVDVDVATVCQDVDVDNHTWKSYCPVPTG